MWFSGFYFLILSVIVEVYLWWKLQASLIFLSGRTCTIGSWLNTFLPHCMSRVWAVELRLHFVSVLTFCLFDYLTEGITTPFYIQPYSQSPCHGYMRWFTLSFLRGSCHLSTVWVGFNSQWEQHSLYTSWWTQSPCQCIHQCYSEATQEFIPVHVIKTILKHGFVWSDQRWINLRTDTSCFSFCL
jgi:hypothetical protein